MLINRQKTGCDRKRTDKKHTETIKTLTYKGQGERKAYTPSTIGSMYDNAKADIPSNIKTLDLFFMKISCMRVYAV